MTAYVSDEEILTRIHAGDRNASMVLFHRYYSRIKSYARLCLGDPEQAERIALQTFQHACCTTRVADIGKNISCVGFLFLLCRRLMHAGMPTNPGALAMHRRLDAATPVPDQTEPPLGFDPIPSFDHFQIDHIPSDHIQVSRNVLLTALNHLPPDDREIIYLAFIPGLSRQDIALLTAKPSADAVTSHLYTAMRQLASLLSGQP